VIERLSLSKTADAISDAASGALFACRSWRSIGLPASAADQVRLKNKMGRFEAGVDGVIGLTVRPDAATVKRLSMQGATSVACASAAECRLAGL
jgi:hypothetical protein